MTKKTSTSVHLRLNEDLFEQVDLFTSKFYFNNRTEALRYLIALGLNYHDRADSLMGLPTPQKLEKKD